jgi:hypothetical protein
VLIDFSSSAQLYTLRSMFRRELQGLGSELTRSERAALLDQLDAIQEARTPAAAQQAFTAYQGMLSQLRSNTFRSETLTQKSDIAAAAGTDQTLRADLARLQARVDYLSRFGQPDGSAFLNPAQTTLLKSYLDRAESRLKFYASKQGDALAVLTTQEAADIRRALDGIAETGDPAGGAAALITQIRAQALG